MKKIVVALGIILLGVTLFAAPAQAAPITGTYTTGGATICVPGPTLPCMMTSTDSTFSVLRSVFDTPVLFGDLTSLQYDYTALLGGIGGGSPRAVFVTDTLESFLVHWGPALTFTDPTLGPGSTGNLLALTDVGRYDLTGIGGPFYTDRASALVMAGSRSIVRISLLLDSFAGNDRAFLINGLCAEDNAAATPVPEPTSLALMGLGLFGVVVAARRPRFRQVVMALFLAIAIAGAGIDVTAQGGGDDIPPPVVGAPCP